jgi:mono/diheme cytochrome c family protein
MFLPAILITGLATPTQAPRRDLAAYFRRACAECHGPEGNGRGATGTRLAGRNLADPRWQARTPDADLVKSILKGKREMPAFGATLTEEEAQRLVTQILRPLAARK